MIGLFSIEKELEIMSKFKLDANHWFTLRYLFISKYEDRSDFLIYYFTNCAKTGAPREILQNLKDKDILDKTYEIPEKGQPLLFDKVIFNQKFLDKYFKLSGEAGRELFEAYPAYLKMDDGRLLPARNLVSRVVFKSLDDFFFFYAKSIKFDRELHEKIMLSLEFAKKNNLVRSAIVEYCVSQKWREHIESMEQAEQGTFMNRFDGTEIV